MNIDINTLNNMLANKTNDHIAKCIITLLSFINKLETAIEENINELYVRRAVFNQKYFLEKTDFLLPSDW
jgi:hypothetical protein